MLIAYQSLNSNSSKTHNLAASTMQRYTRETNAYVTGAGHDALVLPHNAMDLTTPIQGPANLVRIAELPEKTRKRKLDDADAAGADNKRRRLDGADGGTANVFGAQISLLWQNFYRTFGAMPDIMVCGEVDASNDDFKNMVGTKDGDDKAVLTIDAVIAKAASQSFTAISQTGSQITQISSGIGYVAYSVRGLNVVFVHVPNEFATEANRVQEFYRKIASSLLQGGKVIHLVIGDTNQSSLGFTQKALNSAFAPTPIRMPWRQDMSARSTIGAICSRARTPRARSCTTLPCIDRTWWSCSNPLRMSRSRPTRSRSPIITGSL
jgi:hypothetical protein